MKTTWTTRRWMKLIDEWMGEHRHATMPWKEVVRMEGGYGKDKISSVMDAMKPENEGTWPGIWFQSGQTDFSVYKRYDYVYSLLFGRSISKGTISIVGQRLASQPGPKTVIDWGGTIFTAIDMLELLPIGSEIVIVNLPSPQMDFANWILNKFKIDNIQLAEEEDAKADGVMAGWMWSGFLLMSETLEHCLEPFEYLTRHVLPLVDCDRMFLANSFCTPAYGHFIPVLIEGKVCQTTRQANIAFRNAMEGIGFTGTKLPGWNSRAWEWTR